MNGDDIEVELEAEVRAVLRRTIVPPPVPEYMRDRVELLAQQPSTRAPYRWLWSVQTGAANLGRLAALSAVVAVVLATAAWLSVQPVPGGGVGTPSAGPTPEPAGGFVVIALPNQTAGFVGIGGAGIRMTADRGLTWSQARQFPPADAALALQDLVNLNFVDAQDGWMTRVVKEEDAFEVVAERTTDGGLNWLSEPVTTVMPDASHSPSDGWQVISTDHFWDASHGIVVVGLSKNDEATSCQRYVTADGGATWSGPTTDPCIGLSGNVLQDPTWITNSLGYVASSTAPAVSVTQDGGQTWHTGSISLGVAADSGGSGLRIELLTADQAGNLSLVCEVDSGTSPQYQLFGSSDGGATWKREYDFGISLAGVAADAVYSMSVAGPTKWFAVVAMAPSVESSPSATPVPTAVVQAQFAQTRLVETLDGGRTWSLVQGQSLLGVGSTYWWDGTHGIATGIDTSCSAPSYCGDRFALYVTSDGGLTWTQAPFDLQ